MQASYLIFRLGRRYCVINFYDNCTAADPFYYQVVERLANVPF